MHMTNSDDVLTTAEAAALIGCSVPTVTRMALDGRLAELRKLPGLRGDRLFQRAEVERAAQSRKSARTQEIAS